MTDVMTPMQRSLCMSRIRARDTRPEIIIRKMLWSLGYRYRVRYKLPGKPDIVFTKKRLVVFIDGCFWHRCPLHYQPPATNKVFWEDKIGGNVKRDQRVHDQLTQEGWLVMRFWEHEVKDSPEQVLRAIVGQLKVD